MRIRGMHWLLVFIQSIANSNDCIYSLIYFFLEENASNNRDNNGNTHKIKQT